MRTEHLAREIAEVRSRLTTGWDSVTFDVRIRLQALRRLMSEVQDEEVWRHVPVSAIAALQTMAKGLVIDLFKMGEPYRTRASELLKDKVAVKDVVEWFHGETITFGEVIAHALTFSSIADVHSVAEKLLGIDLKGMLAQAVNPLHLRNKKESPPLIKDVDSMYRDLDEAFSTRHILAHEAASGLKLGAEDAQRMLLAVQGFVDSLDAVLWQTAYAHLPLTTHEINVKAGTELEEANQRLATVVGRTRDLAVKDGELDPTWFDQHQRRWQEINDDWFRNTYEKLQGTMWPSVGALQKKDAIEARIKQLRDWNASQLGDQSDHPDHPYYKQPENVEQRQASPSDKSDPQS